MANKIKVLFWLHRSKMNKEGLVPLIVRLTYQKQRTEKATGFYVIPDQWNITKQRLKGTKTESNKVNLWLDSLITKVNTISSSEVINTNLHLPAIMDMLFAKPSAEPTLLKIFEEFNFHLKERVGKDFAFSTYEKYEFTFDKVKAFIKNSTGKNDVFLRDITTKFIMDFDHYLRVNDNNQHNTAVKYCINLKRVLNVAVIQGSIQSNPFINYKTVYKDTVQVYLEEAEVIILEKLRLLKPQYLLVRDLFIFQCYTGLAYTDMTSLNEADFRIDSNGKGWIIKARQKTGVLSTIPLLPQAISIIDKYKGNPGVKGIFPHYSIQKYNKYLGEIGDLAGINKKLSSHVGRRTFGNVALSRGISINVISKILGHANTLITQRIYAITTQKIIDKEIEKW